MQPQTYATTDVCNHGRAHNNSPNLPIAYFSSFVFRTPTKVFTSSLCCNKLSHRWSCAIITLSSATQSCLALYQHALRCFCLCNFVLERLPHLKFVRKLCCQYCNSIQEHVSGPNLCKSLKYGTCHCQMTQLLSEERH